MQSSQPREAPAAFESSSCFLWITSTSSLQQNHRKRATPVKNFAFYSTASLSLSSSSSSSTVFTFFVHKLDISGSQSTDILKQSQVSHHTSEQKTIEKFRTILACEPRTKAAANHNSCRLNKVGMRRFAQSANTSRVVQVGNELLEERLASSAALQLLPLFIVAGPQVLQF